MPDVTMCHSTQCPRRRDCRRNEASGTKPSEHRQAWADFWHYYGEGCAWFMQASTLISPGPAQPVGWRKEE